MPTIFVGYEIGVARPVEIPIFHMLVTGQTRLSGKTTALKALAKKAAAEGFKVLVLDTKTNQADYTDFGEEVPVCLRQTTDSLILLGLLESIFQRKITRYYSTLTEVTENAKTFVDVIQNAEALKAKTRVGFVKDACASLIDLLKRLLIQTRRVQTTTDLQLPYKINRMSINAFDVQSQQLIAKTVFEEALHKYKKLIIVLDEAYKFLPQKWSSACGRAAQDYVTQGGATELYLWMSTQFLATTSKDTMKTMAIKLLGTQDHDTECQHTVDLVPSDIARNQRVNKEFIMHLKLGHFVVVTKEWVKVAYACPETADQRECQQVALGLRTPEQITFLVPVAGAPPKAKKKEEKKVEPSAPKVSAEEEVEQMLKETKPKPEQQKPLRRGSSRNWRSIDERFELLENKLESLRLQLKHVAQTEAPASNGTTPNETTVNLETVNRVITVTKTIREAHITSNDDSTRGKILTLAKEGFFSAWRAVRDVVHAIEDHRWTAAYNSIKDELPKMAEDGLLGMKKERGENKYVLAPNVRFVED
jgi:hypothetical protein